MCEHRAAWVVEYGTPTEVIRLADRPRPDPGPGMVEIAVERAAINPSDLIPVSGAYSRTVLPFVPGFEGVGIVERVGQGVDGLRPGDRVLPLGANGLWQDFLQRPAEWCFAVPDDLSTDQAATAYINPMTTLRIVDSLREHFGRMRGRRIAVTAAGSAIGRMLLKTLLAEGADVTAIVRSERSAQNLQAIADVQTFVAASGCLGAATVFDAVIDAVGGDTGETLLRESLARDGVFLQYGALSGVPIAQAAILARPDVRFSFLWLRSFIYAGDRQTRVAALAKCFDGVRDGTLATRIAATYPLSRVSDALAHHHAPGRNGKILLHPHC